MLICIFFLFYFFSYYSILRAFRCLFCRWAINKLIDWLIDIYSLPTKLLILFYPINSLSLVFITSILGMPRVTAHKNQHLIHAKYPKGEGMVLKSAHHNWGFRPKTTLWLTSSTIVSSVPSPLQNILHRSFFFSFVLSSQLAGYWSIMNICLMAHFILSCFI